MRTVSSATTTAWQSGAYIGTNRPMVRATVQNLNVLLTPVDTSSSFIETGVNPNGGPTTITTNNHEIYAAANFGQTAQPVELPNIKSVKWSKSVDTDAATMTMELYNVAPLPIGATPENVDDFGQPGFYVANRGEPAYSSRWGYSPNNWQYRIAPDRILRTYEGYGFDASLIPEKDPHMYQTGVWLIDDVIYGADGIITVAARDLGRLLIDQICFPPVVPLSQYPLQFVAYHTVPDPPTPVITVAGVPSSTTYSLLKYEADSGIPYVGLNGTVYGHHGSDAFDSDGASYWLSIGNAKPSAPYSYEWVQGDIPGGVGNLLAIRFTVWAGPYRCYVSIKTGGAWLGSQVIPYDPSTPPAAPNGANIPFISAFTAGFEGTYDLVWNVPNAQAIRLTFTDLYNSGIGPYPYRAGVRSVSVTLGTGAIPPVVTLESLGTHPEGNWDGDYTSIVKKLLAYGGFYWPNDANAATNTLSDGSTVSSPTLSNDALLGQGRVWGDIELTGTQAPAALTVDIFDKKPLADGIVYCRNIVGFNFFIDETGGAVFRSPNIWQIGNFIGDNAATAGYHVGEGNVLTIDESLMLMDISVTTSSRNLRENFFVANTTGKFGAVTAGFSPFPTFPSGLRRVGGYTDAQFGSTDEAQIMADLLAVRTMFTYRVDKVVVPGYPAFQIDDQVRIYERVTNEGYIHYIAGIDMEFDMETGLYQYTLSTHWLGESPFSSWAFDPAQLSAATQLYLQALGKIP